MNRADIERLSIEEGQKVTLLSAAGDGVERKVVGLAVIPHRIPEGCVAAYYPECNPLVPLWDHAQESKVPATKSVPVYIQADHAAA